MRGKLRLKDARDGKGALLAVLIVVILLVSTVGVFLYATGQGSSKKQTVSVGDTVTVNYTGYLPDGRVFATTLYTVANDSSIQKSLFFSKSISSLYTPVKLEVGSSATYYGAVKGFSGVAVGKSVGETFTYTVAAEDAYGSLSESKKFTFSLNQTIDVYYTMTVAMFKSTFGTTPHVNDVVQNATYGWDIRVLTVDSTNVVLMNAPDPSATYRIYDTTIHPEYGWNVTVSEGPGNTLVIHNELDESSVRTVGYVDSSNNKILIVGVDEASGVVTAYKVSKTSTNPELVGVALTYTVTIVSID